MSSLLSIIDKNLKGRDTLGDVDIDVRYLPGFVKITFSAASGHHGAREFACLHIDRGAIAQIARDGAPSAAAIILADHEMSSILDKLEAVVTTTIPNGAEWIELGQRRVWPEQSPAPPPIVGANRRDRTYQRLGDPAPRAWPAIAFYTEGRRGVVVRSPAP